jgi:hypothetical protein
MSLTTASLKSCSLETIQKSIIEATLYTLFFNPKTQSEAIKLMYGIGKSTFTIFGEDHERVHKSTSNININPITNARHKLLEKGFLIKMDDNLRNSIFKASSEPITNYIKNKLKLRKSRITPDPSKDYVALSIILDSEWFRSFFSNDFLLNPITHTTRYYFNDFDEDEWIPQVYHPYGYIIKKRMTENKMNYSKLEVYDVTNLFSYLIEDIGAYSWGIVPVLKKINNFSPISSQEIIQVGNFDNIIRKYEDTLPDDTISDFYSYCYEGNDSLEWEAPTNPRRLIEKIIIPSSLIPQNISEIMVRAGRNPLTLMGEIRNLQYHLGLFSD